MQTARTTDVFSFSNQDHNNVWIDIPDLNQIWVRNTLTLFSSNHGYAHAGYDFYKSGPAFMTRFITQESTSVPEPSTILILGLGILSLLVVSKKKKINNQWF